MTDEISVIIPIYNAEQYIYGCVESVLRQTYTDFELILIDDGSSDGSGKICEKLSREDKRIRFIRQEHRGVSAARNIGIDAAKGKYIFFLDCDDMIHPQLLEKLYKLQERNRTVVATVGLRYIEEEVFQEAVDWRKESDVIQDSFFLSNKSAMNANFLTDSVTRLCAIGGKMILHTAVETLRFNERLTHGEDTLFVFRLLTNGANVSVLLRDWYYYRNNKNGSSKIFTVETCKSRYKVERYICDYYIKYGKMSDALYVEWNILKEMVLWYEIGRQRGDSRLKKYMERLVKTEKEMKIYSQLERYKKVIFYVGCNYYPFYRIMKKRLHHL